MWNLESNSIVKFLNSERKVLHMGLIIGMAVATVASAVTQKIFSSVGKMDEAQYLDLATKSGLTVTALTVFAKVIKAIAGLGA
jgi:hypothetical protein